ncbi:hypothetical protein [Planococcus sp. 107-1]|uniref:phage tail protein n=1 Tax=Planococcus sp. 107-1 TaxID=2908840 RepID=UPI001F15FC6C|nr:hypothetical protein [Planococcus sp. 107-1]UJF27458.1 hypothetical protein L0M13_02895 [Planococcus sp. 107-1]
MVKVQGVTITLGADASGIETALSDVNKASGKTSKELQQINRALKFDPDNVNLLQQRFDVLQDAARNAAAKLDTLRQAQVEVNRQFAAGEIDESTFRAFNREVEMTEGLLRNLQNQARQTQIRINPDIDTSDLQNAEDDIEDLGDEARETGRKIGSAISKGAAVGSAAIAGLVTSMQETNTQLAMLETQAANAGSGLRTFSSASKQMSEEELAEYEEQLAAQETKLEESMESREDTLSEAYSAQKDALAKSLDTEYKEVSKAYERQERALQDSLDAEFEALEEASERKMKLIDKEYMEKLKLIDEDRYNRLKAIDDEIAGLRSLSDAEDKAAKNKENADQRAALQADIDNQKTKKGRRLAAEKLAEFEAKLRADQIQEDRNNQIEALTIQKDGVNETFDKKKEAIENEYDLRKEQAAQELEIDKETLKERQALEMESLKATNQSRLENLKEQQDESKKALDSRLGAELEAVKKAHQEELDSFRKMSEEKVKTAQAAPVEQKVMMTASADVQPLSMEELQPARVNFASVDQDVGQITEAMGNLIQAGYTTEEALTKVSKGISGAIVKYGETFTAEGLAESITTTSQLGEVTGQLTDLMEKSGVDVAKFNEELQGMSSTQERSNAIAKLFADQGLNDVFDQYVRNNQEIVKNAEAQQRLQDAMAGLAEAMAPVVTAITNIVAAIVEWMADNKELSLVLASIITVISLVSGAILALVPALAFLPTLIPIITGAFGALAGILPAIGSAIAAIAAPVAIAIAAIAALIGIVALIVKNWEPITEFFSNLWSNIKDIFVKTKDAIFDVVGGWILDVMRKFFELKDGAVGIFKGLSDAAVIIFRTMKDVLMKPVNAIRDAITSVFEKISSNLSGIWQGITDSIKKSINFIIELINDFIGGMNTLKIPDWVPAIGGAGVDIPNIPMLAKGTEYFKGGPAIVGEKGPELVDMPRGSRVTSNDKMAGMMGGNVTVQQMVVREEADIKRVARELYNMQQVEMRGR